MSPSDSSIAPALPSTQPSTLATRLGYAGLLPFVLLAMLTWIVRDDAFPFVVDMLSKYAAIVIAFLGGLHWGLAMRGGSNSDARIAWSIVPGLLAWVAAVMPPYAGLVVQGGLLVVCYMVDRKAYPQFGAGAWLTLRFRLTVVASLSCFLAAKAT